MIKDSQRGISFTGVASFVLVHKCITALRKQDIQIRSLAKFYFTIRSPISSLKMKNTGKTYDF